MIVSPVTSAASVACMKVKSSHPSSSSSSPTAAGSVSSSSSYTFRIQNRLCEASSITIHIRDSAGQSAGDTIERDDVASNGFFHVSTPTMPEPPTNPVLSPIERQLLWEKDYLHDSEEFFTNVTVNLTPFERGVFRDAMLQISPPFPNCQINQYLMKQYKKRWLDSTYCKDLTKQKRSDLVKAAFYALVVRQYILNNKLMLPTQEEILARFSFLQVDLTELVEAQKRDRMDYLLGYCRGIEALLAMGIAGHNNKKLFLAVGAMLEGSGQEYATGGAPSKATERRICIFHEMTGTDIREKSKSSSEKVAKKRKRMESSDDGDCDKEYDDYMVPAVKSDGEQFSSESGSCANEGNQLGKEMNTDELAKTVTVRKKRPAMKSSHFGDKGLSNFPPIQYGEVGAVGLDTISYLYPHSSSNCSLFVVPQVSHPVMPVSGYGYVGSSNVTTNMAYQTPPWDSTHSASLPVLGSEGGYGGHSSSSQPLIVDEELSLLEWDVTAESDIDDHSDWDALCDCSAFDPMIFLKLQQDEEAVRCTEEHRMNL